MLRQLLTRRERTRSASLQLARSPISENLVSTWAKFAGLRIGRFGVPARTWRLPAYRLGLGRGWSCFESFDETLLRCSSPIAPMSQPWRTRAAVESCQASRDAFGRSAGSEDLHFSTRRSPDMTLASVKARLEARFAPSALPRAAN
jgi:hypothetical protein